MAVEVNVSGADDFFAGADHQFVVTITSNGAAQDITGWTLSWKMKDVRSADSEAASITKTTSSGIALTTPASGIATVSIADTDTASLRGGLYKYELWRTNDGSETPLVYGTAYLQDGIHG